jgi:uncharacterized protein (TIGR02231 family)
MVKHMLHNKYFQINIFLFLISFVTIEKTHLSAQSNSILAPIQEVIVYSDRALVTRNFKVNLKPGKHTLRFTNGNADLDPNSLRAESKNKLTTIIGIQSFLEMAKESNSQELRKLEVEIRKLENQENSMKLANMRLQKDLTGIQEYSQFLTFYISEASVQDGSENGNWNEGLKVLSKRRKDTKTKIQSIDSELVLIKKKLDSLKKKLDKIQSKSNKSYRVIEVSLQTSQEVNSNVNFSYMVPNAGWNVSYGMHLNKNNQVRIEYYGNIKQETGEDWNDVNLYLSTAKPSLGGKRSPLQPLKIFVNNISTHENFVQSEKMSEMMMADDAEETLPTSGVADGSSTPTTETGGFSGVKSFGESLQFRIPKKVTIPTEKRTQKVTIAEFDEKISDNSFKIFPTIQLASYRAITSKNSRSFPMLPGSINLFRDSGFIGSSFIKYTPAGQDFNIGFGIDESIRVNRDIKTFREETGALRSGQYFHTHTNVEINNQSDESRKVIIYDRIPVSEVSEIKVEILGETTQGYKEERKGILKWEKTLPPRSKSNIELHYRVRTPEDFPGTIYGK